MNTNPLIFQPEVNPIFNCGWCQIYVSLLQNSGLEWIWCLMMQIVLHCIPVASIFVGA
jgi:hypothetical protein